MTQPDIHAFLEQGHIDPADLQFASALQRIVRCDDPWVVLAAALVSRWAADGHVCLDLNALPAQGGRGRRALGADLNALAPPADWRPRLRGWAAVGRPGDYRPLILDGHRLYLHRFWTYERRLAEAILERSIQAAPPFYEERLDELLRQLFPEGSGEQRTAAQLAATRRLAVISGGPGTGKTYTIAKIIVLLRRLHAEHPPRIHLAAPTGKAAARLQESVEQLLTTIPVDSTERVNPIHDAQTLHRLLGYMPAAAKFQFNAEHPLLTDAVIVDEASMIDLALMYRLMQAIPAHARLILVGDKDQLASVEAGAVLGDICYGIDTPRSESPAPEPAPSAVDPENTPPAGPLAGHIVVLNRSYRFKTHGGIGALGRAINAGDAAQVLALLADERLPDIALRPLRDWPDLPEVLREETAPWRNLFESPDPVAAFTALNRFKILTALRKGPFGVEDMNRKVEERLRRDGRIRTATPRDQVWYPGRPVMITRNDYHHDLFNGDVGIAMATADAEMSPELRVVFPGSKGAFKSLAPHQLAEHQTVYAMTIHKSQGSEFDRIMIVLPDEETPLLTRELIYTAVTRARRSILIWADPELLARAVQRPIRRASGLRFALWAQQDQNRSNSSSR